MSSKEMENIKFLKNIIKEDKKEVRLRAANGLPIKDLSEKIALNEILLNNKIKILKSRG